jgi:hypothetical protein
MERFWSKVEKTETCWIWTGSCPEDYGRFFFEGRIQKAHHVAWKLTVGPIPKGDGYHGICVLHRCDNRKCVRPDHLFLGTHQDNMADREAKQRNDWSIKNAAAIRAAKQRTETHCKRGHLFDAKNTKIQSSGHRQCRECQNTRKRELREQRQLTEQEPDHP